MSYKECSERFGVHGKNLWLVIAEVGKNDRPLADKLANEYESMLQAMIDILDCWGRRLEH
jgi:hypothetical protein